MSKNGNKQHFTDIERNDYMKKSIKKVVVIAMMLVCLCSSNLVFAHEIYHDSNGSGVVLKWGNLQSGLPYLTVNGDYLSADYSSFFNSAVQAWPTASSRVKATTASFSTSKVDMCTPTEEYWEERFGWLYASSVCGITDIKDSAGTYIDSLSAAENSSGTITYAQIYMNPDIDVFEKNDTFKEKTMVHELGHVLCLGHSDGDYYPLSDDVDSIMKRGSLGYKTPQSHDITDLSNKY